MERAPELEENSCAILLAAGSGSRFHGGTHKLLAPLHGRPVYRWALQAVLEARLGHVVVVTGAADLDLPDTVIRAHNPDWAQGQATSLQRGLLAAAALDAPAVVVGLGDQPFVTPSAWRAVAGSPGEIAVATYGGVRGNPVLLRRNTWPLLPTAGDQGARSLMALRPELVVDVACDGSPADIDTMEDLQQWNSSTNSPSTDPSNRHGRC
jgi:molybdenum cofactor cytidylyltransferase